MPFDPPVGQTLRYQLTQSFFGTDGPSGADYEQTLSFEPNGSGDGFLLTVGAPGMPDSAYTFDAEGRLQRLYSIQDVAALLAPVITVETNSAGRFLWVKDWEVFRENLRRMPELALRSVPDELTRQRIRSIMREWPDPADNLTAESAPGVAIPLWSKIFGFGGTELVAGQPREWSNTRPFLDGEATLKTEFSLMMEPTPEGNWAVHFKRTEIPQGFVEAVERR